MHVKNVSKKHKVFTVTVRMFHLFQYYHILSPGKKKTCLTLDGNFSVVLPHILSYAANWPTKDKSTNTKN